jgi:hypothetical protein
MCVVYGGKYRDVLLVTHPNELCAFHCFVGVDYGCLVCDNANTVACSSISPTVRAL